MKPFLVALLLSALVGGSQANNCGHLPDVENANGDTSGYTIGNWAYYTCDKGYILYGRNRILCTKDGWNKPSLFCQKITDPPTTSKGTVTEGEERTYGDKENYPNDEEIKDPPPTSKGTVTEGEERTYGDEEDHPDDEEIKDPPPTSNGTVTEGEERTYGDEEDYPKDEGNILTDQETTHRMGTGAWSHPPPSSTEIKDPPTTSNGTVTEGEEQPYGDKENYPNDEGNILTDQETTHRMGTGAWSHPPPSRTEIKDPPPTRNGTVTEGEERTYGDKENYPNDESNILTDQETTHRMGTGAWSHPPPSRTEIKCDHPPTINNGRVTEGVEWPYGAEANYSCDKGYTLTGQETIQCMDTGAWSHPPPNCTGTFVVYNAVIQEPEVIAPLGVLAGFGGGMTTVIIVVVISVIIILALVLIIAAFIMQRKKQGSYRLTLNDEEADSLRKLTADQ
ncbi:CUB and sushi domain-containing protein 3-like isoform X4 [Hemitrygon akajei]|uniref:CUB and sushi domain-containing protein 3-like isoform X4 n=1 Tax=Hemitrygon akajei TaxID=2704970 RepID=UPI003BFA2848